MRGRPAGMAANFVLQRLAGRNFHGGTTIAATMLLAHRAGIKVFGTGGLGGVHRGGEASLDVSADLSELGRTPVAVVSSGCKGFLDIPRTLEFLETQGVGVATFADGRKDHVDFPAFWSRDSGFRSPSIVESEIEAAAMIRRCIPSTQPEPPLLRVSMDPFRFLRPECVSLKHVPCVFVVHLDPEAI